MDAVPALMAPREVPRERFERRSALLELLNRPATSSRDFDDVRQRAALLTGASSGSHLAPFSLEEETAAVRERYGSHRFGRAMLMSRRLIEAGVSLVAIHFNEMTVCDGWDTHSKYFEALQSELLPMVDQSLSALLEDLEQRGLLGQTLVVVMGEFGRTPKINAQKGRDHFPDAWSVVLAGGGIRGGQALGRTGKDGMKVEERPVGVPQVLATVCAGLGIDHEKQNVSNVGRPIRIVEKGTKPIHEALS